MSCIFRLLFLLKKLQFAKQNKSKSDILYKKTLKEIQQFITTKNVEVIIDVLEQKTKKLNNYNKPLSPILIDKNYNIYLSDYDIEIELSHLTKAIYILFLKHRKGIYLPQLKSYEKQLFYIYKGISYQSSLDKMRKTVNSLVTFKNNDIYTHLSRIKREFYKKLPKKIALHYCIKEKENKIRSVQSNSFAVIYKFIQ